MYRELAPPAALAPYVDRLWTSRGTSGPRLILPDGCIDIIVDLVHGAFVVGAMTTAVLMPAGADVDLVAVRFRPGGAAPFLRIDAGELTDRRHDQVPWLRDVTGVRSLVRALLARLPDGPNRLVAHTVTTLASPAPPTIDALARDTGYTRQYLGKLFHAHVGISPKLLGRVARMQRAMILTGELADVALAAGYCDQAHMSRDFKELAGVTPAAARAVSIHPIRSLYAPA